MNKFLKLQLLSSVCLPMLANASIPHPYPRFAIRISNKQVITFGY